MGGGATRFAVGFIRRRVWSWQKTLVGKPKHPSALHGARSHSCRLTLLNSSETG